MINDESARYVIGHLSEMGIKIPQELRIISFDDLYYSKNLPVPLTTVRQPSREIGNFAAQFMLERIKKPNMSPRKLLISGQLIVRESCGANIEICC